jgi:hypothetical protein
VWQCCNADINLFDSKHDGKVYYEKEIFKENLSSILKIFTIELSHGKFWFNRLALNWVAEYSEATWDSKLRVPLWHFEPESLNWDRKGYTFTEAFENYCYADLSEERTVSFKITDSNSCRWMFLAVHSVYACWISPETPNRARKRSVVAKTTEIYCARALYRRGRTRSKTNTAIRAAECSVFGPCMLLCMMNRSINTKQPSNRGRKGSVVVEMFKFEKYCGLVHGEER